MIEQSGGTNIANSPLRQASIRGSESAHPIHCIASLIACSEYSRELDGNTKGLTYPDPDLNRERRVRAIANGDGEAGDKVEIDVIRYER
jgi:hypothetical protein